MLAFRMILLASWLLGMAGAVPAQEPVGEQEPKAAPAEPLSCIPFPHEQEHYLVARGMPYSGKRVMTCEKTEPDGTVVKGKRTQMEWRDSQGRFRIEQPDLFDPETIRVDIVDPVKHTDWIFSIGRNVDKAAIRAAYSPRDDSFEYPTTYQTLPGGSDNRRIMANPLISEGPGFRFEELKSAYVNGVWCEGSRSSHWRRPGEGNNHGDHNELEVTVTWFSVDLFTEVLWKMDDPSIGKYRNTLIHIDRSEPDPDLFRPPRDYHILVSRPQNAQ